MIHPTVLAQAPIWKIRNPENRKILSFGGQEMFLCLMRTMVGSFIERDGAESLSDRHG